VDLRQLAQMLRKKGRGRDTVLAHITPQEAKLLKARGGRGSINPKTGLPEFEDDFYDYGGGGDYYGGDYGGDYGGGGDYGPIYEYYDEPAQDYGGEQDATGFYEDQFPQEPVAGGEEPTAQDPNVELLSATQTPGPGDELPSGRRDPDLGLSDEPPAPVDENSRGGFLEQLFGSGGLGSLGLGGNGVGGLLGNAALLRLLAAGGAGATAVRAGEAARDDANRARNDINIVADNAKKAGDVAQIDYEKLAKLIRDSGNVGRADINALADTSNKRAVDIQTGLASIAGNAAARAPEVQRQYNELASPYQTQGREMARMGLEGGLTPASAQAFQAAQARLAQQGFSRGGVASAQAATQLESFRAQLLGDQYRQGLDTQQIGDRYASQGISAGLAQSNLGDALNANALNSGLAQYNYANNLSTTAIRTGMSADTAAASLSSAGIVAALNASGISDRYLIQGINTYINGNKEARTAMQGFWSQIGNFVAGGTSPGNAATTTARA
jgi:hypothetical protein